MRDCRPGEEARSISEVLLHVAAGNFMQLELVCTAMLKRSFETVRKSPNAFDDGKHDESLHFVGEQTTICLVCLRPLAHAQMMAYLRINGINS